MTLITLSISLPPSYNILKPSKIDFKNILKKLPYGKVEIILDYSQERKFLG